MYYFLSVISGILIASMIPVNGALTAQYGVYSATVLIHVVGLLLISLILWIKKVRIFPQGRPPYLWLTGGAIGVATTVCNNVAFGKISVSAILALSLLAQSVSAILIDQFGLLRMKRTPFAPKKLIGLALVLLGIGVMLLPAYEGSIVLPVAVSLLSGVSIVLSRTINAGLAIKTSDLTSTLFNYIIGLCVALVLMLLLGQREPLFSGVSHAPPFWAYFGGWIGVFVVLLSNITVKRISGFYITLLIFIGQVFSGIVLDLILTQVFSLEILLGGILVTAGLAANLLQDARKKPDTMPV